MSRLAASHAGVAELKVSPSTLVAHAEPLTPSFPNASASQVAPLKTTVFHAVPTPAFSGKLRCTQGPLAEADTQKLAAGVPVAWTRPPEECIKLAVPGVLIQAHVAPLSME
jgi:hypothetical protein